MPHVLYDLNPAEAVEVQGLLRGANGVGLVVTHPFPLGVTGQEVAESVRRAEKSVGLTGSNQIFRDQMLTGYRLYLDRLERGLAAVPDPVGFAFLAVGTDAVLDGSVLDSHVAEHLAFLEKFDPRHRIWVVSPTLPLSPEPVFYRLPTESGGAGPLLHTDFESEESVLAAWDFTLRSVRGLDLSTAWLGGAYLVKYDGQPTNPAQRYACVNHLGAHMQASGLFDAANVMAEITWSAETKLGLPGSLPIFYPQP